MITVLCICAGTIGSAVVESGEKGAWSGTEGDFILSDPGPFPASYPAIVGDREKRVHIVWQETVQTPGTDFSSEVKLLSAAWLHSYGRGEPETISFLGSTNPKCAECTADVVTDGYSGFAAVWTQKVILGANAYQRVHFGYWDPAMFSGSDWSSKSEDFILSDLDIEHDAVSPKIAMGEAGRLYAAWAQYDGSELCIKTCVLGPVFSGDDAEYDVLSFQEFRLNDASYFEGLDIAYHNERVCLVWTDAINEDDHAVISYFADPDGFFDYRKVVYADTLNRSISGISLNTIPPYEDVDSDSGFENGKDDDSLIFHLVFGLGDDYENHQLNHTFAKFIGSTKIVWEAPQVIVQDFYDFEGNLKPDMIMREGEIHLTWRGWNDDHKECYYALSTDSGKTWSGSEDDYEMISFNDGREVNCPQIALLPLGYPCVVWQELSDTTGEMEIHYSYEL